MTTKVLVFIRVQLDTPTCYGCALQTAVGCGVPRSSCLFMHLCGDGQFQAKLLNLNDLSLEDLPDAEQTNTSKEL